MLTCKFRIDLIVLALGLASSVTLFSTIPVVAQNFPSHSLDQMLNQVDNSNWNNVPVSRGSAPAPSGYGAAPQGGNNYYPNMQRPMPYGGAPAYPQGMTAYNPQQFAPIGGIRQPLASGPPPFSRQSLLRIFLSGGSGGMGGGGMSNPQNDPSVQGNCEAQLQIARDQCQQAENDAARASYASSKSERMDAASSAQYHANAARSAADNAYSSSYGKSQTSQDYAAQARNAANRAQEAADRARYNADSYTGSGS